MQLNFTSDYEPGIRRLRQGKGFVYVRPGGRRVSAAGELSRIRRLAVPPAYRDVWICADPRGHLQATGRDARGRKQYRYHAHWRLHRDVAKFDRMLEFGRALPRIRRRVAQDLRKPGLRRERVLATLVRLLEFTLIRVGNQEYVRANGSYGLTTLRDRHVRIRGGRLTFEFRGKGGKFQQICVEDPLIARIVRRCGDMPGQELFQWVDEAGERHRIDSRDVNDYLREASGASFTAKDFRTWFATLETLQRLCSREVGNSRHVRQEIKAAVAAAAERLGNTPTICRRCYIHPEVLTAYAQGRLAGLSGAAPARALRHLLRGPRRSDSRVRSRAGRS